MIPAVIAKVLNPNAKIVIPTGIATNESNVKSETQLLAAEIERKICSI